MQRMACELGETLEMLSMGTVPHMGIARGSSPPTAQSELAQHAGKQQGGAQLRGHKMEQNEMQGNAELPECVIGREQGGGRKEHGEIREREGGRRAGSKDRAKSQNHVEMIRCGMLGRLQGVHVLWDS